MDSLFEIVDIVKTIKLKSSDLLLSYTGRKNQAQVFYEKLVNRELHTDQEAAQYFFKTGTTDFRYKNLKRYLKEKLLSSLFFIEPKQNYGEYDREYIYCCKNMMAAKILINFGTRETGINICKKVFKKALRVELTEFILETARYLRLHHGTRTGSLKEFNYYNKIFKKYQDIAMAESLAEEYYTILMLPYVKSKATNESTSKKALAFYELLEPYLKKFKSPLLHFYGRYILIISHLSMNDYNQVILHCEKAIKFFENKPYGYNTPLRVFLHTLLLSYVQTKNFPNGKVAASKAASLVLVGTHSWYVSQELSLLLALHSKEYAEAWKTLKLALDHPKFKFLSAYVQERWLIYKAYVYFLAEAGKLEIQNEGDGNRLWLGKILNSVPNLSRDKRGLNIPVLIIQILFMIIRKDYDKSLDRFEAIQKYCSRYLHKGDGYRSNCFINMLLQIPKGNFHKSGVARKAKKWYDRLTSAPLDLANQPHEIEIIPYEDLWGFIMDSLDSKFAH